MIWAMQSLRYFEIKHLTKRAQTCANAVSLDLLTLPVSLALANTDAVQFRCFFFVFLVVLAKKLLNGQRKSLAVYLFILSDNWKSNSGALISLHVNKMIKEQKKMGIWKRREETRGDESFKKNDAKSNVLKGAELWKTFYEGMSEEHWLRASILC